MTKSEEPPELKKARAILKSLLEERSVLDFKIGEALLVIARLEEDLPPPNYWVRIDSCTPKRADTFEECWDLIGQAPFGSLYYVTSPKGLSVDDFIPHFTNH